MLPPQPPLPGLRRSQALQLRQVPTWWDVCWRGVMRYGAMLLRNTATILNAVIIGLAVWLWVLGYQRDAVFTSMIVVLNVLIASVQTIRADIQLQRMQVITQAYTMVWRDGELWQVPPTDVVVGDVVLLKTGDQVVADMRVCVADDMYLDEAILTGESEPVPHVVGDVICAGAVCVRGAAWCEVSALPTATWQQTTNYGHRLVTPLIQTINRTIQRIVAVVIVLMVWVVGYAHWQDVGLRAIVPDLAVVAGLIPNALLLTLTVSYAVAAVQMARHGGLVQTLAAVEAMHQVDIVCLDKTGTLTTNQLVLAEVRVIQGETSSSVQRVLAGYVAADGAGNRTTQAIARALPAAPRPAQWSVNFDAVRKWSMRGEADATYVLGAPDVLCTRLHPDWQDLDMANDAVADGHRVLLFARAPAQASPTEPVLPDVLEPLALLIIHDELRPDARAVIDTLQGHGMRICLISGDDPQAVRNLVRRVLPNQAVECVHGADIAQYTPMQLQQLVTHADVYGRVTPDQKAQIVAAMRAQGWRVAMVGDGVNDIAAMSEAHVAVAMQSGSSAVRRRADVIALSDSLSVLPQLVMHGQSVMYRMQAVLHHFLTRVVLSAVCIVLGYGFGGMLWSPIDSSLMALMGVAVPAVGLVVLPLPLAWLASSLSNPRLWWRDTGVLCMGAVLIAGAAWWWSLDVGMLLWWYCVAGLWARLGYGLWQGWYQGMR